MTLWSELVKWACMHGLLCSDWDAAVLGPSRRQGHGRPWPAPHLAASAQPQPRAAAPQDDEHPGTEPALKIKAAFAAGTFVLGLLTVAAPVAIIPTCQHQSTPDFALFRPVVRARPPAHARAHAARAPSASRGSLLRQPHARSAWGAWKSCAGHDECSRP